MTKDENGMRLGNERAESLLVLGGGGMGAI